MTNQVLVTRLSQLKPHDDKGVNDLAAEALRDSREAPAAAVDAWKREGDPGRKAMELLPDLEDAALFPLVSSGNAPDVPQLVWSLRTVGAGTLALRAKMARAIQKALDDKRQAKPAADASGPANGTRVCDEAYLQLRRLLSPEARDDEYVAGLRAFLAMDHPQKDEEIAKVRKSPAWTQMLRA